MSPGPSKLQRWLDVIAFLASRRLPVSTEELWAAVPAYARGIDGGAKDKASVRRMFERDKDELRALGIPLETVRYTISYGREVVTGYRLAKRSFHLPYLRLLREARSGAAPQGTGGHFEIEPREAAASLDGLRELSGMPGFPLARAARSAFRKLAFDLEPESLGRTPIVYAIAPEASEARDTVGALADPLRRRKTVTFTYHAISRDAHQRREVRPYGLLFQHGRWYLVAHDIDRDGTRMFRLGRMSDVRANEKAPGTPDFEIPPDFRLDEHAGRRAWELHTDDGETSTAEVHFGFPRSLWAERNRHGELVQEDEDGGQLRSFPVRRRGPFLRWVLSLAGDARVRTPADLRDEFVTLAARVAELHRDEGATDA